MNGSRAAEGQLLEGGTGNGGVGNAQGDGAGILDDVIALGGGLVLDFSFASLDGHGVAVRQRYGQRTVQRLAYLHSKGRLLVFGHIAIADDAYGNGIDAVVDDSRSRRRVGGQLFEVTTCGALDGDADGRTVVVDVIGRGLEIDAALGLARFNGDGLAVGQGHGHRSLSWIAQGHGVGDHAAFGHRRVRRQGRGGDVDRIVDRGLSRRRVGGQLFEVTARGALDGDADGRTVVVDVVGRGLEVDAALGLARFNGDGLAVGQGHGHRSLSWIAQGHGVGDHAAFGHRRVRRQGRGGDVDRIVDRGLSRRRVGGQLFEVTARGALDGDADGRTVVVDVVGRGLEVDAALALARFNGDGLAVGQGHGHRRLGRVAQGHGIGDHAAFGHAWRSSQRSGGGVDGINDLGNRWCLRQCHRQPVATGGTRYGRRDLTAIDIRRVVRRDNDVDATAGLPGRNDDYSTVGQGDDQIGSRRLTHRGGINDHATRFADGRSGAKNQVGSDVGVRRRRSH